MIVVDANLLIYAYNDAIPEHDRAKRWLETAFAGSAVIALPWAVIHAFLRLTTSRRILPTPLTTSAATEIVNEWLSNGLVRVIDPGPRYWQTFRRLVEPIELRGNILMDAHLAALALEHDATLYTADRDFRRFGGLRVVNPLA